MRLFRRARNIARPVLSTRLRVEQLEDREVPAVISGFTETLLASGLSQPTAMAVAPDGRIFVAEKGGTLRVVQNGNVLATPFLTVSVNTVSERGLVGVAVDPNFSTNGFVYVYYSTSGGSPVNRVSRFASDAVNPNVAQVGSENILVNNIPSTNGNHNGGALAFAPDGTLFVGIGEAGVAANAQDPNTLAGKILRINPTNGSAAAGNPNISSTFPQIWALGLRNPFTMAVQPTTGRLFINDVGAAGFEEVNEGAAGANYGWPQTEGPNPPGVAGVTYPIYSYPRGTGPLQGQSIAGGAFYNPANGLFPSQFVGDYFFGDFLTSRIFVRDDATGTVTTFAPQTAGGGVVDLDVLPDGRLLYLSFFTGTIYQITPVPAAVVASQNIAAAGTGASSVPLVTALNADGSRRFVAPVFPGYTDVRVATGDVTGDGIEDVIAVSGPGGTSLVTVYDGTSGLAVSAFFAVNPQLQLGFNVAAGDVSGDGRADVILGTATGTSLVAVFDGLSGQALQGFFAFPGFVGGVTVAAGDVDNDGRADIIVGTASFISAISIFSGASGAPIRTFLAFGAVPVGVNVGFANGDIVAGTATGLPAVATYSSAGDMRLLFLPAPGVTTGVRVAGVGDQLLTGIGPALLWFDRFSGNQTRVQLAFDAFLPGSTSVG